MNNPSVPQPDCLLTVDEFLNSLNQSNSAVGAVAETFQAFGEHIVRIYRKDASLRNVLAGGPRVYQLPIVDKPLRVVIEMNGCHDSLTSVLFAYHYASAGRDPDIHSTQIWGDLYIDEGYGYYFSGALLNRKKLIIGHKYRPDMFDRDIMTLLGLDVRD